MGLDFSYLLYFPRENLWDVLQSLASLCRPSDLPTLIVFPDHMLPLSMEPWDKKDRMMRFDEEEFGFTLSIYFPLDEAIREYAQRAFSEHYQEMAKESPLGFPIGYVYTTVNNGVKIPDSPRNDPKLALIEFGTTGTRMSLLFSESDSIRRRFCELLNKHAGICGVFNMENDGEVIWWKGRNVQWRIGDPFLHPDDIQQEISDQAG